MNNESQILYDYIIKNKIDDAIRFVNSFKPTKLYKCYFLDENLDKNKDKLETLHNNELWFSSREKLDDPTDFYGVYVDKSSLKENYAKQLESIQSERKNDFAVCCFSDIYSNELPMWAHYANNHKGFRAEFDVQDSKNISKVFYVNNKLILKHISFTYNNKLIIKISDDEFLNKINYFIKNEFWSYQNEYRIVRDLKENSSNTEKIAA